MKEVCISLHLLIMHSKYAFLLSSVLVHVVCRPSLIRNHFPPGISKTLMKSSCPSVCMSQHPGNCRSAPGIVHLPFIEWRAIHQETSGSACSFQNPHCEKAFNIDRLLYKLTPQRLLQTSLHQLEGV